jgi:hypothetical protein
MSVLYTQTYIHMQISNQNPHNSHQNNHLHPTRWSRGHINTIDLLCVKRPRHSTLVLGSSGQDDDEFGRQNVNPSRGWFKRPQLFTHVIEKPVWCDHYSCFFLMLGQTRTMSVRTLFTQSVIVQSHAHGSSRSMFSKCCW